MNFTLTETQRQELNLRSNVNMRSHTQTHIGSWDRVKCLSAHHRWHCWTTCWRWHSTNKKGEEHRLEEENGFKNNNKKKRKKIQAKLLIFPTIALCFASVTAASVCERLVLCAGTTETSVPIVFRGGQYKAEWKSPLLSWSSSFSPQHVSNKYVSLNRNRFHLHSIYYIHMFVCFWTWEERAQTNCMYFVPFFCLLPSLFFYFFYYNPFPFTI